MHGPASAIQSIIEADLLNLLRSPTKLISVLSNFGSRNSNYLSLGLVWTILTWLHFRCLSVSALVPSLYFSAN